MANPVIRNRNVQGDQIRDIATIENLTYNERAGARKSTEVGRYLVPLTNMSGTPTTDASGTCILPNSGCNIAVYNNSSTLYAITFGDSTMTAQASGVVQTAGSPTAPFVGLPCQPNTWSYFASGIWNRVASQNSSLLVFLIDDASYVVVQPATNSSNAQQTTGSADT